MPVRNAYIIKCSKDEKRFVCIDVDNESAIMAFLKEDTARVRKFYQIVDLILANLRNTELYAKEEINEKAKGVTAMKMFKRGQNIRIYCKEQSEQNGTFYVIVAELLPKKKDQKVKGKTKSLIETVGSYEYKIVKRP